MPIHDWTTVMPGVFHDFHHEWIGTIKRSLNAGRLPAGYYAMAEQIAGGSGPDIVTLENMTATSVSSGENGTAKGPIANEANGGLAVATAPPKVRFTATSEMDSLARKRNRVVIRHSSGHRVVAVIEIVSPGNKSSQQALHAFVAKAVELIEAGIHLLVVDLFPPGPRDPQGIHGAIWSEIEPNEFQLPAGQPLTLAAYSSGALKCAYIEAVAVHETLPDMPLFLEADVYIPTPLEASYQAAWSGVPQYW
ncbi:MAG TPA: DUF4058 family protein, partial [Gemmataceae bacterium]|nr:DUF4058 family protein [Gemmataceae bacterium]